MLDEQIECLRRRYKPEVAWEGGGGQVPTARRAAYQCDLQHLLSVHVVKATIKTMDQPVWRIKLLFNINRIVMTRFLFYRKA